jgi:predicted DNA-binding transcriptional regulator YafY
MRLMARSVRMFEIIQLLRNSDQPRTAQSIAENLDVTKRTVYRDIASLQALRVPIEGEAGVGYVMRSGFDLPPINFDVDEAEAIIVGLAMITRTGNKGLKRAARSAAQKLADATPLSSTLFASSWGADEPKSIDLSDVRKAIREEHKSQIAYQNAQGIQSSRTIMPIAIAYHSEAIVLAGWCELKNSFRHFRPDRISFYSILPDTFLGSDDRLRQEWIKSYSEWL